MDDHADRLPSTQGDAGPPPRQPDARRRLRDLARQQFGLLTSGQLTAHGLHRDRIQAWKRTGELEPAGGHLWRLAGSPRTDEQVAMASLLRHGEGAALAVGSAAAVWGFVGFELLPAHVIRLRRPDRRSDSGRHTSRRFDDGHVTIHKGLRVTTPARTLFDLAGSRSHHPKKIAQLTNDAIKHRLTTVPELEGVLRDLEGRGRAGIVLMRGLIAEHASPDYQPTDSALEARFEEVMLRAGILSLRRQVVVGDEHGVIGRVDFADAVVPLLIEVQSELHHRSLLDQQRDRQRIARLRAQGFVVLEVRGFDVWHRPDTVVDQVLAARAEAKALRRSRPA